jgi:hypothetical protein
MEAVIQLYAIRRERPRDGGTQILDAHYPWRNCGAGYPARKGPPVNPLREGGRRVVNRFNLPARPYLEFFENCRRNLAISSKSMRLAG